MDGMLTFLYDRIAPSPVLETFTATNLTKPKSEKRF